MAIPSPQLVSTVDTVSDQRLDIDGTVWQLSTNTNESVILYGITDNAGTNYEIGYLKERPAALNFYSSNPAPAVSGETEVTTLGAIASTKFYVDYDRAFILFPNGHSTPVNVTYRGMGSIQKAKDVNEAIRAGKFSLQKYLGPFTTAAEPSVDNEGAALTDGALYFNTTLNTLMVYDLGGTNWQATAPSATDQTNINIVAGELVYKEDLGGVAEAVTTSSGNNITDVADNETNINNVAAQIAHVATLGPIAANITTVAGISANVTTVAGISANTTTVAGVSANVTTVAGIASNVTAVAGDASDIGAVAAKATEIGRLGTADAVADMAILGSTTITDDMALLAIPAVITDMALLAIPAVITDMDLLGASGVIANVATVAGVAANVTTVAGVSANVTTVATAVANVNLTGGSIANVNTVAAAIADVNRYAAEYTIASSAPGSPSEGDLWYDSTNNVLKYHTGSTFAAIAAGIGEVADDTSPTLGGDLDVDGNDLTNVATISGANLNIDFGSVA